MPTENFEAESLEKNPDLELAQLKFLLSTKFEERWKLSLIFGITTNAMAPFYEEVCKDLQWTVDNDLLVTMKAENEEKLKNLNAAIEDAEKNSGEMEIREACMRKAEYLSKIGSKEQALEAFYKIYEKTVSKGFRLDILFHLIRIGLFYMDHDLVTRNIEKAKYLVEEGGDWDRRNRLKVYQGVYCMAIRDFKGATNYLIDAVSTFTSYELTSYKKFVSYTVLCSMISLPRVELNKRVIKAADITEVLHSSPMIREFLSSLYNCEYSKFFTTLAHVENMMKKDRLLAPHCRFYVREMRILAYSQLMESYKSLTLVYMADAFGVTVEFMDKELAHFIGAGRLNCKIDKVGGIVETNRPDHKNYQYQTCIKQGDVLLNRIQKLSRIISI